MYARAATVQLKPGTAGDLVQRIRSRGQQLVQQTQEVKGIRGTYALLDHQTNQFMSITFFDTEEAARAFGQSNLRAQLVQLLGEAAEGEPKVSVCEVVLHS